MILDLIMVFGWGKKKSEKQEPEMAPQKKYKLNLSSPECTLNHMGRAQAGFGAQARTHMAHGG